MTKAAEDGVTDSFSLVVSVFKMELISVVEKLTELD